MFKFLIWVNLEKNWWSYSSSKIDLLVILGRQGYQGKVRANLEHRCSKMAPSWLQGNMEPHNYIYLYNSFSRPICYGNDVSILTYDSIYDEIRYIEE